MLGGQPDYFGGYGDLSQYNASPRLILRISVGFEVSIRNDQKKNEKKLLRQPINDIRESQPKIFFQYFNRRTKRLYMSSHPSRGLLVLLGFYMFSLYRNWLYVIMFVAYVNT